MTHPRDHILTFAAQLRSDMTTLANVTCKVRVNGGAATTYTNVSTPAITQYADITYGYELKVPANTYADGDVVEATWLYSASPYAIDSVTIGPTAVDGAHFTNARGDLLANLDTAVSGVAASAAAAVWASGARTLTAFSDSAGVTTLLSRLAAALTITGGKIDVNDKTGFGLTSAYDPAKTAAQAGDAMALTSGERTALTAVMWNALTSGLSTVGSIGKLLATNVDAAISTRLATSGYTAPDNSDVVAIKAKTDNLPADPASQATVLAAIPSASTIASTVWGAGARTLTAFSDTPGVTTLLSRLTSGRAALLDFLDIAVSRIPSAMLDELLDGHATAGTAGQALTLLGTGAVAYVSPTARSGLLQLDAGEDYKTSDGTAITWTGTWPTLTSVSLTIGDALTVAGTVGAGYVSFDLTAAQTASLPSPTEFVVWATLSSGSKRKLLSGLCTVT